MIPGAANANPGIAMWTAATRKNYSRKTSRYQSDVTDEEWRVIEPHLPPARTTGRPRAWPLREIVNGIFYVMRSGRAWRQLPTDLPPWSTVYRWFAIWGAVADRGLFRIDFGFIGDVTAVAPSIDLHDPILYRLSFRYRHISGNNTQTLQFRTSIKLNW
jgi:transposase